MNLVNNYGTPNNIEVALRMKEFLGNDHGMLKYWGIDMCAINHYRTPGMIESLNRLKQRGTSCGVFKEKEFRINKIKFFKDIPDGIEILIDYVDATALRTMNIPAEIIYESIYRVLPELFEE